jgi:hypothetical protein
MADGFKIADAYVDVETKYDKDKLVSGLDKSAKDAEPGIRRVGRDRIGKPMGDGAGDGMSIAMRKHFAAQIRKQKFVADADLIRMGNTFGEKTGKAIPPAMIKHFRSDLRGKPWMLDTLTSQPVMKQVERGSRTVGRHMSKHMLASLTASFGSGFVQAVTLGMAPGSMSGAFRGNPIVTSIGVTIGALLATAIAAGLASTLTAALAGVFGGGVIGLGAFLLKDEPELARAATRLGDTFKRTFATAAGAMLMPFVGALNIFSASILRMQPTIDTIFRTLSPAILPLAEGLAAFLEALGPGLEALAVVGADVLIDLAKSLPGWGRSMSDFFILIKDNWPEIKRNLHDFFRDLGKALKLLAAAFIWLSMEYSKMKARLKQAIMPPGLTLLIALLHSKWARDFMQLVRTVRQRIGDIVRFFRDLPGRAAGATSSLWGRIRGAFRTASTGMRINAIGMVSGFVRFLSTLPGKAANAIRGLKGRITGVFSGASTWLWNAGWNLISGLVSGIRSAANSILSGILSWVTSVIPDWKGPERVDRELLRPNGAMIIDSLTAGMKSRLPAMKLTLNGVTAGIPQVVKDSAPKQYMSTSTQTSTIHIPITVHAGAGADGTKVGREAAREIRKALDDYDRSVKK